MNATQAEESSSMLYNITVTRTFKHFADRVQTFAGVREIEDDLTGEILVKDTAGVVVVRYCACMGWTLADGTTSVVVAFEEAA